MKKEFKVENKFIGEIFSNNSIDLIDIDKIDTQAILISKINDYLNNDEKNLCIFRFFRFNEMDHLHFVQITIENMMRKNFYKKKHFIFIIYLIRELEQFKKENQKSLVSFLSNWDLHFIDNLNGKEELITNLMNYSDKELLDYFFNEQGYFLNKKILTNIFNTFNYKHKIELENNKKKHFEENRVEIIEDILKNNWFLEKLKFLLYHNFKENILFSIFFDDNFKDETDFYSILFNFLNNKIESYLINILSKIQNDQMLMPLLDNQEEYHELFNNYIQSLVLKIERVGKEDGDNKINIYNYNLKIPNFLNYSKNLISFIQKNQKDFSDLDNTNDDDEFLQKRNDLLSNIENYFEKIIGNNKEYIEKEYIQKIFIEDYCKYFIISNLNIINKEDLDHCIYILNFFIRQEIKFFCKEETGLRKLIEIFAFLKRNPFIEIILILFKTFEKNKIKQIFQSIESEINAISNSIIDSYFEGEPFAQIFNLLFKFLCLSNFDEIKDDNFDNLLYFIGNIEKIKNIIKFSSSYMMNFRNILLIYNATKNYDNIKQYAEIGKNQNNSKDILNAQFSFIKNILKEKNKNEFIIEFLYNKLREDLENELTIEIFKKLIQQKDIDLILSSKEVIDSILKKTIFNDFTFDYNGDYHELINIINIIKESIENKNEFIQELNKILNNNENNEEKNIGESLKIVLINWFENIFYLYFQKLKVEEIAEEQLDALINCLEDLNEINNKKLRDIFSVSYIKNILQFLIKSKSEYINKMQNIDKYKKMILEKSNMEKAIKIYMNKIDYRIQGNNYNTITKENNFICDDFFDKIIIINYKKINEYISIIKKIGSINEDLNEEHFDSFFDIFLNFYANAENENRFSNNIKSIFQKALKSKKLNEKQRIFYKNDFNDFIKNKTIINNEISTYIKLLNYVLYF